MPWTMAGIFSSVGARVYRLLFADDAPEERRLPVWAKYALPLVLFALIRFATAQALDYREVHYDDDIGYVEGATYIVEHGHVANEDNYVYRQFPGLSLLMIVPNVVLHNMVLSGYVTVVGSAILAVCLVQFLFNDFRLTVIFTFFFPWWITTTVAIFSEPSVDVCFLLCFWALRDARPWSVAYGLGILAGGYALVIRQPALFFIMPFIGLYAWRHGGGSLGRGVGAMALATAPLVLYLTWNWVTIHQLFPQAKLQYAFMMSSVDNSPDPEHYSRRTLDWPFRSLINGLTDPYERPSKKAITLVSFSLSCAALVCLIYKVRTRWKDAEGILATAFTGALVAYFAFHLCVGGLSSYRALDRYMSQLNVPIEWALFYRRPLRWPWIALLAFCFMVYSFYTGPAPRPLGIFK